MDQRTAATSMTWLDFVRFHATARRKWPCGATRAPGRNACSPVSDTQLSIFLQALRPDMADTLQESRARGIGHGWWQEQCMQPPIKPPRQPLFLSAKVNVVSAREQAGVLAYNCPPLLVPTGMQQFHYNQLLGPLWRRLKVVHLRLARTISQRKANRCVPFVC